MTVDEIANYCEFKDCQVTLGDPAAGFIRIDGSGIRRANNYNRFLSHNELAGTPSPGKVLDSATVFTIHRGDSEQKLSRPEFEAEYERFFSLVGG